MPKRRREPELTTTWRRVLTLRLARQRVLERAGRADLLEVVSGLVGLHAQVMSAAELQAAVRIDGLRRTDVADALWRRRSLVKTWAFRQTLHLLTADDLAAFVLAARSLERWHTPAWLRYFKMTETGVAEVIDAIGDVLTDRPMTRVGIVDDVVQRVRRPHLRADMLTGWGTFLGPAAQRGKLVFGPSEGRNVAFVDPSDWLGRAIRSSADEPAADEALAGLIARYLAAFPGSSREMIARWWGGGRLTAVTRALGRMPVELAEIDVEGTRGLVRRDDLAALAGTEPAEHVRLLPGFDPFTNELPRHVDAVLDDRLHDRVHRTAGWVTPIVVLDARVGGTWELETGKGGAGRLVVRPFGRWRGGARKELEPEVDRLSAYLERRLTLEVERSG
jgi:phage baseplate assembly protein gpV